MFIRLLFLAALAAGPAHSMEWHYIDDNDDFEGRTQMLISEADRHDMEFPYKNNKIALVVRKVGKNVETFINLNRYLCGHNRTKMVIQYRFDDGAAVSASNWNLSTDRKAIFPDRKSQVALRDGFKTAKSMKMRVSDGCGSVIDAHWSFPGEGFAASFAKF